MAIKADYDPKADQVYLTLGDRPVARTVEFEPRLLVDLDSAGRAVGVDMLEAEAASRLGEVAAEYRFKTRYAAARRAVDAALRAGRAGGEWKRVKRKSSEAPTYYLRTTSRRKVGRSPTTGPGFDAIPPLESAKAKKKPRARRARRTLGGG